LHERKNGGNQRITADSFSSCRQKVVRRHECRGGESENWKALDGAVLLLRQQPDLIALIADLSQESSGELYDSELSRTRVATVECYRMAAGVNRRRLHIQEHTAVDNSAGSLLPYIEDTEILNEILYINLQTNRSQ
jgi:hypothetical protein